MSKRSLSPRELLDALGHGGKLRAPEGGDAYVYIQVGGTWKRGHYVHPLSISALYPKGFLALTSKPDAVEEYGLSEAGRAHLAMLEGQA